MKTQRFISDFSAVRQVLVDSRLGQSTIHFLGAEARLEHFAEAVLASAGTWLREDRLDLCRAAAEISEALASNAEASTQSRSFRLRAALLYELAELPAL